jgi:hypothetical protein
MWRVASLEFRICQIISGRVTVFASPLPAESCYPGNDTRTGVGRSNRSPYLEGRMKQSLALLAFVVLFSGCVPLREIALLKGPAHPDVSLHDQGLLTDFDLNREKIDTQLSYIESPAGSRYRFQIQPHQFDIDQKRNYVSALLYPFGADGSEFRGWRNGIWSFHFVVQTNGVNRVIDQQWKIHFFCYSPIIHGAPN